VTKRINDHSKEEGLDVKKSMTIASQRALDATKKSMTIALQRALMAKESMTSPMERVSMQC